ncbi:MAG: Ig-like domain-containing protein [Tannerella sp.]|jgi:hypothetical protein|nr:Ig-like domain-containing protein [Tannerella sp.]
MKQTFNKTMYFTLVICIYGFLSGCDVEYKQREVEKTIYVDKSSIALYVGNTQQLTVSPADGVYNWTSEDESIAKVSLTGLVEATGEGTTNIIVSSGDIYTRIEVKANVWVPLTDITGIPESLNLFQGDKANVTVVPVPLNASEVPLTWVSENPEVVTVSTKGKIEAVGGGTAYVSVSSGDLQKRFLVSVAFLLDNSDWTVEVSDWTEDGAGNTKDAIIDGNIMSYWHSSYTPKYPFPHWAIIDMKTPKTIMRITTYRAPWHNGTKTIHYLIGDSPDINAPGWREFTSGDFTFVNGTQNPPLTLNVSSTETVRGQYLQIYLDNAFNANSTDTQIGEVYVYGTD